MLIMTSIIRVGQSRMVTVPIDEDSNERIMNCLQTLSELHYSFLVLELMRLQMTQDAAVRGARISDA